MVKGRVIKQKETKKFKQIKTNQKKNQDLGDGRWESWGHMRETNKILKKELRYKTEMIIFFILYFSTEFQIMKRSDIY